ncbi:dihydrofolate reductase family protein [Synechococcus elongatus]|uniref:Dihydrofolate reductase family protein n=1 Tax=Synechococcus elongatus PCC 11801 TaxID=2219813 RepID=A0AAN1QPG1_SYNEL|nr:dihydrofolate reductase family protein [Synechococcus elongatus]AZB72990.1 dihydrofolate reductase [Synechococcus elongatus PCC 11801]
MTERLLILFIATSLDGYIARLDEGIDWLFDDADYGYSNFYAQVDTVLMGRKTYDLSIRLSNDPYPGCKTYVFSRSLASVADPAVTVVQGNPGDLVTQLQQQPGRHLWLVGGGQLVQQCLAADCLDQLIISIHPILLGSGIPLFSSGFPERHWQLIKTQAFPSGLVQCTYNRVREE